MTVEETEAPISAEVPKKSFSLESEYMSRGLD